MTLVTKIEIQNNCYSNNAGLTTVNTNNVPFVNNDASYAFYNCNTVSNVYNLDPNITNMSHAFEFTYQNYQSYAGEINVTLPTSLQDASHIFRNRPGELNITLPESITNAYKAFDSCYHLKKVTGEMYYCANMSSMYEWTHLASNNAFDYANYTASQAENIDMSGMFKEAKKLQYARPLPANAVNIAYMFYNTQLSTNLTIPNKVVNMCNCFYKTYITSIPTLPDSVEDISYCFLNCQQTTTSYVTIPQNVVNASWACVDVRNITTFNFQSQKLTDLSYFTANTYNDPSFAKPLRTVEGFLPNTLTNMHNAFLNSRQLVSFCGSNTAEGYHFPDNIEDMSCCFDFCQNLSGTFYLPTNLVNGHQLFYGSATNNNINLNIYGTLNTPVDLSQMFRSRGTGNNYINLTISLNNLTNIFRMFDTTRFTGEITFTGQSGEGISLNADRMFYNTQNVVTFPNGLGEANIVSMGEMFFNAKNLTGDIKIKSPYVSNATNCFYNTTKSKNVYIPFTYANGVNTITYNTFKAIYGGGANGVTLINYVELYG